MNKFERMSDKELYELANSKDWCTDREECTECSAEINEMCKEWSRRCSKNK